MPDLTSSSGYRSIVLEARVIRADGRVEDLGAIAYWHRNPLRRWAWRITRWLRWPVASPLTHTRTGAPP